MMFLISGAAHDKCWDGDIMNSWSSVPNISGKRLEFFLIHRKMKQLLPGFSIDCLLISPFITCGFACFSVYVHEWMVGFSQLMSVSKPLPKYCALFKSNYDSEKGYYGHVTRP